MNDHQTRVSDTDFASSLPNNVIGLVLNDPQLDRTWGSFRQLKLLPESLREQPARVLDLRDQVALLEVESAVGERDVLSSEAVTDGLNSCVIFRHDNHATANGI